MSELVMNEDDNKAERPAPDRQPSDMHRRQRGKNIALALLLAGLVVLFYIVAIVKMGGS
jgi:hypothetical protein